MQQMRVMKKQDSKGELTIADLILVAVLIAAGAVLKMCVGSVINFFGMKPNFIIAMYCLAIALIRPKVYQAAIIGLITGAVCQFLPGTPWLNFISELIGAVCMCLMRRLPLHFKGNLELIICTFVSTTLSGGSFVLCLLIFLNSSVSALVAYVPIVLGTAVLNCVIVQVLYYPIRKVLDKN